MKKFHKETKMLAFLNHNGRPTVFSSCVGIFSPHFLQFPQVIDELPSSAVDVYHLSAADGPIYKLKFYHQTRTIFSSPYCFSSTLYSISRWNVLSSYSTINIFEVQHQAMQCIYFRGERIVFLGPNTNTNIIWVCKFDRIRILFVFL